MHILDLDPALDIALGHHATAESRLGALYRVAGLRPTLPPPVILGWWPERVARTGDVVVDPVARDLPNLAFP